MQESVFDIPIPRVLDALGKGTPETAALRPYIRKGMFLSPFTTEKTPSFHWVNNSGQNCWHCFATGQGGGVLDLVMLVRRCDKKEAAKFLEQIDGRTPAKALWNNPEAWESGKLIIDSIGKIRSSHLLAYGAERGIPEDLLRTYFAQVRYHYKNKEDKRYTSLGCPNIKNGFTLCNKTRTGKIKICSSCAPTFIDNQGRFALEPSSETVYVTEGIWDALSMIEFWRRAGKTHGVLPRGDMVILNSTSMANKDGDADRYISKHAHIRLLLDHDGKSRTGQKRTRELIDRYTALGLDATDASGFYMDYKDINDCLMAYSNKKIKN